MLKFISKNLFTGLMTILPIMLTVYLVYWLAITAESVLGNTIRLFLPDRLYSPGMGVVLGLFGVFVIGLLMRAYVVRRVFAKGEQLLYRVPVVKWIYRSMRDFLDYFSPTRKKEFEQVVLVRLGDTGMQAVGFVTQAVQEELPEGFRGDGNILVYLPMSYMIGGYTVLMPRSAVKPVKMSIEEAMRFTLTAGVTGAKTQAKG